MKNERPYPQLRLLGLGHFHPENVVDNDFFSEIGLETSNEWIVDRVGIIERRTVLDLDYIRRTKNSVVSESQAHSLYTNAQTAAFAARMAMERARVNVKQIGLVVSGGCSAQDSIPAEACRVAAELGIAAPCFDLNSACSTFAAQLNFLKSFRWEDLPEYVLILQTENTTRTVDYRDRNTAVLWGDGSTAAVVSFRRSDGWRVAATLFESDPSGWEHVRIPSGGHFRQNGTAVQSFAVRKSSEILEKWNTVYGVPDVWIAHQANLRMIESVAHRAGLPLDDRFYNVDRFGNCGAAGAPSVLSQRWDEFTGGESVHIVVVGSGLSWGAVRLEGGEREA